MAPYSPGHPAGSPLWLQYRATLCETDHFVVCVDLSAAHNGGTVTIVNVLLSLCGMTTVGKYAWKVVSSQ